MKKLASADWRRGVLSRMWRNTKVRWRLLLWGSRLADCMWAGQLPRRPFMETIPRRPSNPELMSGSTGGDHPRELRPWGPSSPRR
jgi:hypothetical protein